MSKYITVRVKVDGKRKKHRKKEEAQEGYGLFGGPSQMKMLDTGMAGITNPFREAEPRKKKKGSRSDMEEARIGIGMAGESLGKGASVVGKKVSEWRKGVKERFGMI